MRSFIALLFILSGTMAWGQIFERKAIINGSRIESMDEVHQILSSQLGFPSSYRHDNDSLYKTLVAHKVRCLILIANGRALHTKLGKIEVDALMESINDAADINMMITIEYRP